ncbi:hypothetical protein BS78_K062600 [Paspalum vaginatum]|uniref:NAC domain-containing protein n=1 Tax=Paspalum vaginatum TaxID=158149 RepID=A0A9W7X9F4_9POAL|nr:hypothetical protein BS78_K062600 [Paspalum vaginatum]
MGLTHQVGYKTWLPPLFIPFLLIPHLSCAHSLPLAKLNQLLPPFALISLLSLVDQAAAPSVSKRPAMVERGVKSEQHGDDSLFLPPGFRFHPTDEEIITSYLLQKFLNPSFDPQAIGEVDLNKCEPWDLPSKAKMGEKEWYFFYQKDMKYPTGMRTNRATKEGYWKATGKDREIYKPAGSSGGSRELVGMKKTLVFYMGRAPRGSKTNWVMHEFRLEGKSRNDNAAKLRFNPKDEWVVCKVHHKNGEPTKKAAAPEEHSAGTPNVSSVEAGEGGDEFLNDDSMVDPVSLFFNSDTTSSFLPSLMNFDDMEAPYNVDYSISSTAAGAATVTTSSGNLVGLPANNYRLNQQVAVANSAAPTTHSSSLWNMLHGVDSQSYSLQHQAMTARALGGVASPNFAGGLPSSSLTAGIFQQNSQGAAPQQKLVGNYGENYAAYHTTSSSGAANKNLGPRPPPARY